MNTEEERKKVCDAWRVAASALSIRVEVPHLLKTLDGEEVLCVAHLPDFGGPSGMVIGLTTYNNDKAVISAAKSRGLYWSFINPKVYERYDEEVFKEALADWGFFGKEDHRPGWLQEPTKSE
jgi:hypothetical protein